MELENSIRWYLERYSRRVIVKIVSERESKDGGKIEKKFKSGGWRRSECGSGDKSCWCVSVVNEGGSRSKWK